MSYKIFGDSCLDLTEELKKDPRFEMIPLTLQVDDHMIMDDETFDIYIKYHLSICEKAELLGASSHVLDILKK